MLRRTTGRLSVVLSYEQVWRWCSAGRGEKEGKKEVLPRSPQTLVPCPAPNASRGAAFARNLEDTFAMPYGTVREKTRRNYVSLQHALEQVCVCLSVSVAYPP